MWADTYKEMLFRFSVSIRLALLCIIKEGNLHPLFHPQSLLQTVQIFSECLSKLGVFKKQNSGVNLDDFAD